MNKFLPLFLFFIVSCGSSNISQEHVESWITTTLSNEKEHESFSPPKYISPRKKYIYEMTNITLDKIGKLQIQDENKISVVATVSYDHVQLFNGHQNKSTLKDDMRLEFNRSTDNNWYVSAINGRANPIQDGFSRWRKYLLDKYSHEPL